MRFFVTAFVALLLNAGPVLAATPLVGFGPNADNRATGQTLAAGTANSAVTVALSNGEGVIGWTVSGLTAAAAVLTAEASNDGGTTWNAVNTISAATGALATTINADGQFLTSGAGSTNARLRVSTVGSGTVTIAYSASSVSSVAALAAPLPAGSNIIGALIGPAASGVTAVGNPVQVGGVTAGGTAQSVLVDSLGRQVLTSVSATPSVSATSTLSSASATTVIAAGSRIFFRLTNTGAAGSSDIGCTDDGTAATVTNYSIRLFANGGSYEAAPPGFVSSAGISCIGLSGSATFKGVYY